MMRLSKYKSGNKGQWDEFIVESKNGFFMFERNYMDYHSDRFQDNSLMFYDEKDVLVAVLPANIKDNVLYSHQGLSFGGVISSSKIRTSQMLEIFDLLVSYCKESSILKILYKPIPSIYHNQPSDEDLYALFRNKAQCFRGDISTAINLRDKIKYNSLRKRNIKKAIKSGVQVREGQDSDSLHDIIELVLKRYHDAEPVHSKSELRSLMVDFPDNIRLFLAYDNQEKVCAGVMVYVTKKTIHCQYTVSNDEGRDVGALDLILDTLINHDSFKDRDYFDLGISTEEQGRVLNEGLISQKEGFGGRGILFNQYLIEV